MSEKNNSEITKTSQGLTQQKPMLPFSFSIHRTAIRIYFALQRVSLSLLAIVYLLISNLRHTYLFWVTQEYNGLAGLFFLLYDLLARFCYSYCAWRMEFYPIFQFVHCSLCHVCNKTVNDFCGLINHIKKIHKDEYHYNNISGQDRRNVNCT